jgi:uncharacterized protein involved in exopolysaccharide biosynthesis
VDAGQPQLESGEPARRKKPGTPVDPARILRVLLQRKWLLLGVFVGAGAVGIAVAKLAIKNTYTTQALLRYEGIPPIEGAPAPPGATQQLGAAVQSLFTDEPLSEIARRMGLSIPRPVLQQLFQVAFDNDQVVRVTTSTEDGSESARFANTVVDVLLERQLAAESRRLEDAATAVEARITDVEQQLTRARAAYDEFRNAQGITNLTTEQEAAIEEAAQLRADRDQATSNISALEARIEQLRRDLRSTPRTSGSVVTSTSREELQLAELRAQLAARQGSLAPDHPQILALQEQINRLQQHVSQTASDGRPRTATSQTSTLYESIMGSLSAAEAELSAARQQQASLTRLASEAQERLARFTTIEGDASRLLGDVRRNEGFLEELRAQHGRLIDASRNPSHGFTIISRAAPPELPDPSKKKRLVAAGVPIGALVLLIVVLLVMELRSLRIVTPKEAAWWGNGPVVGASTWPRQTEALDELIADLDDQILKAQGTMLVVSVTPERSELARTFCQRLGRDWVDTTVVGGSPFDEAPPGGYPSLPPDTRAAHALVLDQGTRAHEVFPEAPPPLQAEAWEGGDHGPALRRAARLADRVCVLVMADETSALELRAMVTKLGRSDGIGFLVLGVPEAYASAPDRVGPIDGFWRAFAT